MADTDIPTTEDTVDTDTAATTEDTTENERPDLDPRTKLATTSDPLQQY